MKELDRTIGRGMGRYLALASTGLAVSSIGLLYRWVHLWLKGEDLSTLLLIPFGSLCPSKSSHSPTFTLKKGHVQRLASLLGLILNRKRSPFAFSLSFRWDRKASTPIIALSARYRSVGYDKHRNTLLQKNCPTRETSSSSISRSVSIGLSQTNDPRKRSSRLAK
ncbi:hypothetical protein L1987_89224 [Smallanthus sonchifolius]|nr:hypothetical protein L1987_89224 [Smallanthus sonchifolius]